MDITRPMIVAVARGILEAVAVAIIATLYAAVVDGSLSLPAQLSPLAVLGLRTLEGVVDERIDPDKERGRLGSALAGRSSSSG